MENNGGESRPISPTEVDMISQVFEELLDEYRIPRDGHEADDLAARLFTFYQSGVRDLELLKAQRLDRQQPCGRRHPRPQQSRRPRALG